VDHLDTLVAPAREAPDRAGALVLGRYRLRERLGAGGFGVVWRAHDERLQREVAVKRIPLPTDDDRERAAREARVCARLAHPAIVALYEADADGDAFYLISELVHGETLAVALAAEELDDDELLEIGVALCDALAHAHARGVVHRDVKPQNILLPDLDRDPDSDADLDPDSDLRGSGSGPVPGSAAAPVAIAKLADFGGARLAGEEALTRTGDVLGTFAYMAPEQSEGRGAGPATDLYALALVLYEGLSGVNPVRRPTPAATVRQIGRPLPPLGRLRRDLPRALTRALDTALSPDPTQRGALADLRTSLWEALDGGPRHRPGVPEHDAPRPDAGGWLTVQRLLWLVAALGGCAWQASTGHSRVALSILAAVLPLVVLVRHPGIRWLAAALAPALGLVGLAAAYPALAGQASRWRSRALLGALGYWWLALAGPLLGGGPRLDVGLLLDAGLLLCGLLWAAAAMVLPWVVRGRSAGADALAVIAWAVALVAATPLLAAGFAAHLPPPSVSAPPGLLWGTALGAALAIAVRALRGRTGSGEH